MNIPKNKRNQKRYMKTCQHSQCDKAFMGLKISKYCEKHRGEEFRERKRTTTDPSTTNRIIKYALPKASKTQLVCECCGQEFEATLYPKQEVYPKYCPEHTNAYRRTVYEKSLSHKGARGSMVVM